MANKESTGSRSGILMQFLPKFIRPMEDWKAGLDKDVVEALPENVRRMLMLDHQFPAVFYKKKE
jgi:ectoine hydroxylase-related dioxygenase (phytanoyl-CoA dioxygenase family)